MSRNTMNENLKNRARKEILNILDRIETVPEDLVDELLSIAEDCYDVGYNEGRDERW